MLFSLNKKILKLFSCIFSVILLFSALLFALFKQTNSFSNKNAAIVNNHQKSDDKTTYSCIPIDVLDIQNDVLYGFKNSQTDEKEEIITKIEHCNTLLIPKNVKHIWGDVRTGGAFQGNFTSLTDDPEDPVFDWYSSNIKNIFFEDGSQCQDIYPNAFKDCDSIENVVLPDSVSFLGEACFKYCFGLRHVELSNSIITIPSNAFACESNHPMLNEMSFNFPNYLLTISQSAFTNCKFSSILFPSTIKEIGRLAFSYVSTNWISFTSIPNTSSEPINIKFDSTWNSDLTFLTDSIPNVLVPKDCQSNYTSISNFGYEAKDINNGLIYTSIKLHKNVMQASFNPNAVGTKTPMYFDVCPNPSIYSSYMDDSIQYTWIVNNYDNNVIDFGDQHTNLLNGTAVVTFNSFGFSPFDIVISPIKSGVSLPSLFASSGFINLFGDGGLHFKNVSFESQFINIGDEYTSVDDLSKNVYNSFDEQIETDLTFSFVDKNGNPITSDWVSINNKTGIFKANPTDNSTTLQDIRIKVQTTEELFGFSDPFSLIVTNRSSYLIINKQIISQEVEKGSPIDDIGPFNDCIYDNLGHKITSNLHFDLLGSLPTTLTFDSDTGKISGTISSSIYNLQISVFSGNLKGVSGYFSILINDIKPGLKIDQIILIDPIGIGDHVNTDEIDHHVTTTTGIPVDNATFEIEGGELPNGLSFDSKLGEIAGTITYGATSVANLRIKATAIVDEVELVGYTNYFSIIITTDPVQPGLKINQTILIDPVNIGGHVNTLEIDDHVTTTTGIPVHNATFEIEGGELPNGLSFDSKLGEIAGTITYGATSVANLRIKATAIVDEVELVGYTNYFSIIITTDPVQPGLKIDQIVLVDPVYFGDHVNTHEICHHVTTTTGIPVDNATFEIEGGELPNGLSLDSDSGEIAGVIENDAFSIANLRIKATAIVDKVELVGYTNYFSIIVYDSHAPGQKNDNMGFLILCSVLLCIAVVYGSIFTFLFIRNRIKSGKQ